MFKIYIIAAFILLLAINASAQTNRKQTVKRGAKKVARTMELSNLATPEVCGNPEFAEKYSYAGTVVKREFADNEVWLNGVVISDADDKRIFINIDEEQVAGLGSFMPRELSSLLTKGRRVKIWVYACGRTLYAYRIKTL